ACFFFQAEDGIRDRTVTGVQTCALPIFKTEFRLIAATNVDLEKAVKEGKFREDLFYRINVIPIKLPPLREQTENIPQLADFFLRSEERRVGKECRSRWRLSDEEKERKRE